MQVAAILLIATVGLAPVSAGSSGTSTAAPASPTDRVLFHLADKRIDEASGVAVATREPQVWFTHNDSGDTARFFALGARGQTLAVYDVDGAVNVDWEDMAAAKGLLWLGDIGDNDAVRSTVDVYSVHEPKVVATAAPAHLASVRYRFRYPDGAHNAESLLVDPHTSRIYIATKSYLGTTEVYAAPAQPSTTSVNVLTHLTTLQWTASGSTLSLEALAAQLATTGGAFSPDGRTLVLRTYTDAYLFPVSGTGPAAVTAALRQTPRRLPLPTQPQGEGVTFRRDGRALVLTSEGVHSAVWQVLIPLLAKDSAPAQLRASDAAAVHTATSASAQVATVVTVGPVRPHPTSLRIVAAGLAAFVVVGLGIVAWRRA